MRPLRSPYHHRLNNDQKGGVAVSGNNKTFVYVGNWTMGSGRDGFGIFRFDADTGSMEELGSAFPDIRVGAACLDAGRSILYCTDERTFLPNSTVSSGQVLAIRLDPATGAMTELSRRLSYAPLASYVTTDSTGRYLLVTNHVRMESVSRAVRGEDGKLRMVNYTDMPCVVLYPLAEDGSIGEPCDIFELPCADTGKELIIGHPHSVYRSPSGNVFAVCDKGADRLYFFRIDRERDRLVLCGGEGIACRSGSAPRYGCFHPARPYFFMNHERMTLVSTYRYDEEGRAELLWEAEAAPKPTTWSAGDDMSVRVEQSDIRLSADGRTLYALTRGLDIVTVFRVAEATGRLDKLQTEALDFPGPRGMALSPDGRFLLIAELRGGKVSVWRIGGDGRVSPTGMAYDQPSPGNVTFYQP